MLFDEPTYRDQVFLSEDIELPAPVADGSNAAPSGLVGVTFTLCAFKDMSFEKVRLVRGCTFEKCAFIGTSFKGTLFEHCAFNTCVFKQADFMRASFVDCRCMGAEVLGARCTGMRIEGGDWSYTNLTGLKFVRQTLRGVRLREAALTNCVFKECDLSRSDLTRATVHGARFESCDLRDARLDGVAFAEASWTGSKIDLLQCIQIAQQVTGATYEER